MKTLSMVTCYDVTFSKLLCSVKDPVDYLLVGDSLGMVLYGDDSTREVSVEEMARHVQAVARGREAIRKTLEASTLEDKQEKIRLPEIIADLPLGSFETPEKALSSSHTMIAKGAEWVKVEGPVLKSVAALKQGGIRVCAHVGLTPQTIRNFKVQGRDRENADRIFQEAKDLEAAGAEMIVLEMVPMELSKRITEALRIPTIGIGAGATCSGQVLVLYDLLGFNENFRPRFLKTFLDGGRLVKEGVERYKLEVEQGIYPGEEHSFRSS